MKKITALILCIILTFSFVVPAFADDVEIKTDRQYENYLVIGDSIAAGMRLKDVGDYDRREINFVSDTYPTYLRDDVGATGKYTFNFAHAGMRVTEVLDAFGITKYNDDFTEDFYNTNSYGGDYALDLIHENRTDIDAGLLNADLITVNLGSNDLMGTVLFRSGKILAALAKDGPYEAFINDAIAKAAKIGIPEQAFALLLSAAQAVDTVDMVGELLKALADVLNEALTQFKETWTVLIDYIYKQNPDVTLAVVGMYNPLRGVATEIGLSDSLRPVVSLLNAIFDPIIQAYNIEMKYGCKYHERYIFVDMGPLEDSLAEGHNSDGMGIHPNAVGHRLMADLIIDALNKGCKHDTKITLFRQPATFLSLGYSGDVVCADCGAMISHGHFKTASGYELCGTGIVHEIASALVRTSLGALSHLRVLFGR